MFGVAARPMPTAATVAWVVPEPQVSLTFSSQALNFVASIAASKYTTDSFRVGIRYCMMRR